MTDKTNDSETGPTDDQDSQGSPKPNKSEHTFPVEIGGRDGPEPVRYGDWEKNGRCIDF